MFGKLGRTGGWSPNLHMIANGIGMLGGAPSNNALLQLGAQANQMRAQRARQAQFAQLMKDPKYAGMVPKGMQDILGMLTPQQAAPLIARYQMAQQKASEGQKPRYITGADGAVYSVVPGQDPQKIIGGRGSQPQLIKGPNGGTYEYVPGQTPRQIIEGKPASGVSGYKDLNQLNSAEAGLRKEATKTLAPFVEIKQFNEQIQTAKETGPDTLALVFGFMKMLDPQSVVRGSEVEASRSAGPAARMLSDAWNKFVRGGMRPELAKQFKDVSQRVYKQYENRARKQYKFYQGIAKDRKMNFGNIVRDNLFDPRQATPQNNDPLGIR